MAERLAHNIEYLYPDGARVFFESIDELEISESPSETSIHEAYHVLAALLLGIGVEKVTNIPEGNALGATFLKGYDARVFAAAHAMGCRGGGHDLAVIEMMEGAVDGAIDAAKDLVSGAKRYRQMLAIATLLDKRGTMGGNESMAILQDVITEQEEGKLYFMRVIYPDGTQVTDTQRLKGTPEKRLPALLRITEREPKEKNSAQTSVLAQTDIPQIA